MSRAGGSYGDEPTSSRRRRDDDDGAGGLQNKGEESTGYSITAMILGIVAIVLLLGIGGLGTCFGGMMICFCPLGPLMGPLGGGGTAAIPAVLALIFGYLGLGQGGRGMAITGMILGAATLILAVVALLAFLLFGAALFGAAAAMPPPQQRNF